ncbi:MAG: FHA domain-containing protein [Nocardioides sp.]|uniref:FHA domain-containing protein n=1 Tax=Nocardioides sp. TaxID=35761 RepID=UPI0039E66662
MTADPVRRSYRPGGWFAIFGDGATVLLPPSEKHRVAAIWELVDEGAGFDEVLDALLASGLRDLPGFVLVSETEQGTKVVLRGPAVAAFVAEGAMVQLAGSTDTTWVERTLTGVSRMFVQLEPTEDVDEELVITSGLVRVGRVEEPPYVPARPASPASDDDEPVADVDQSVDVDEDAEQPIVPVLSDQAEDSADEAPAGEDAGDGEPEVPPADFETFDPLPAAPTHAAESVAAEPIAAEPITEPASSGEHQPADSPTPASDPLSEGEPLASGDRLERPAPGVSAPLPDPEPMEPVARLLFSSGPVIDVDRAVLIGRAPEMRRFAPSDQPMLVTVPSPHQEISSTHLEVRPGSEADLGHAVVTDLGSTNGTVLMLPGQPPEDLKPGMSIRLQVGAIIDLGDGATIRVTGV